LQYVLARTLIPICCTRPDVKPADITAYLYEGGAYSLGDLPGQLFWRASILIVAVSLGYPVAGIYVYVRQIYGGIAQMLAFVKRVEMPRLVACLLESPPSVHRTLVAQSVNLGVSLCVPIGGIALYYLRYLLPEQFTEVAIYVALFSAVFPAMSLSGSFEHVAVIQGRVKEVAIIRLSAVAASGTAITAFTGTFGLPFIAVIDVAMYLVQIAALVRIAHTPVDRRTH
jgi:O-antigen/teichoic acid export membrane protein